MSVPWTEEQQNAIVQHCMDLAANVGAFRQVLIITIDEKGVLGVVRRRRDDATAYEYMGVLQLILKDELDNQSSGWEENHRPLAGDKD